MRPTILPPRPERLYLLPSIPPSRVPDAELEELHARTVCIQWERAHAPTVRPGRAS